MSKWLKTIFIISLALNFLVIGAIAGKKMGFWRGNHHSMHHHVLKIIPEEKREKVRNILDDYKSAYPRRHGKMIKNWEKFEVLLVQNQFDRETFLTTFNKELEDHNERWISGGKVIADIAGLLTTEERKSVLKKLKRKMRHRKHRHKHH